MINKILDNYYTNKLINYIKREMNQYFYLKILAIENKEKETINIYFNYCNEEKELKKDIHIITIDKKESLENLIDKKELLNEIKERVRVKINEKEII